MKATSERGRTGSCRLGEDGAKSTTKPVVRNVDAEPPTVVSFVLKGFGNNGGEEFLSYLLISESLVILGDEQWAKWNDKMHGHLQKIQNKVGNWTGHHCITSHVFCTAAVVQCLTADRDAEMLLVIAMTAEEESKAASGK